MSKRKKTSPSMPAPVDVAPDSADAREATEGSTDAASAEAARAPAEDNVGRSVETLDHIESDAEVIGSLVGESRVPAPDNLDPPTGAASDDPLTELDSIVSQRKHLRGLLESLVFASDTPIAAKELAKLASSPVRQVIELLGELKVDYSTRGIHLDEVAGGWVFRTSPRYAPFVRDLTKQRPVRLTRSQVETLAIIAYRQPITRPEIDDVRGVDSGPVLKLLLERDLVRILGKRDEPGRPMIYGTTGGFLEFFGLKSLKDLPTLREFTELSEESRDAFEEELGESPDDVIRHAAEAEVREAGRELEADGPHADRDGFVEGLGDAPFTEHDSDGDEDEGRDLQGELDRLEAERELQDEEDAESASRNKTQHGGTSSKPHASDKQTTKLTSEAPSPDIDDIDDID